LPTVPLGTLAANLIGGYLVGAAVAVFHINAEMPPELKLFFITGFLGALTTFSTFSAEVVHLIQNARYGWALGCLAAPVRFAADDGAGHFHHPQAGAMRFDPEARRAARPALTYDERCRSTCAAPRSARRY
jgi:hypothetical protein